MAIDEPKGYLSAIAGLLLIALGLIPLLSTFGVIGWNLPTFMLGIIGKIVFYIAAGAGLWLIVTGFMEDDTLRLITIVLGVIILVAALIPLLNSFGVIGFSLGFLNLTVFQVIFVLEGILLIIAAFAMY